MLSVVPPAPLPASAEQLVSSAPELEALPAVSVVPEAAAEAVSIARSRRIPVWQAEVQVMGFHHGAVGSGGACLQPDWDPNGAEALGATPAQLEQFLDSLQCVEEDAL